MPSFTTQLQDLRAHGPVTKISLSVGADVERSLIDSGKAVPAAVQADALIDTGATGTVVQQGLMTSLGLNPVGVQAINTPSSTNVPCDEYLVRLLFPNNVLVEASVIEAPLQGQNIQVLIGRDILQHGVLVYIGYINAFSLSF